MPTGYYEYTCGHGRTINPQCSYFNPYLSFQHHQRASERYIDPPYYYQDTSAASALESLDRDIHAHIAGHLITRYQQDIPIIRIQPPRDDGISSSGCRLARDGRPARVLLSVRKPEKRSEKEYYKHCPHRPCRRSEWAEVESVERDPRDAELRRMSTARSARCRADSWFERYERETRRVEGRAVKFQWVGDISGPRVK